MDLGERRLLGLEVYRVYRVYRGVYRVYRGSSSQPRGLGLRV